MKITVNAPAKINLYLDVVSRLENGFHGIESIMQTVSLCDKVTVTAECGKEPAISVCCNVPEVPQDERNIAYKAARLYLDSFGITGCSVDIKIEKSIPVCAGLAGGSTNAAAVLTALNSLFGGRATDDALLECAARLGSDVPFCLTKGTMLTKGRGEAMTPVPPMPDCTLLICSSGESVSTAWAYGELDRLHGNFENCSKKSIAPIINALDSGDIRSVTSNMYNIFEDAVFPLCPKAKESAKLLIKNGAAGAMMSGSGSSVFGIFTDRSAAENAKKALETDERKVFLCRPQ